jgi:hypothetical protein
LPFKAENCLTSQVAFTFITDEGTNIVLTIKGKIFARDLDGNKFSRLAPKLGFEALEVSGFEVIPVVGPGLGWQAGAKGMDRHALHFLGRIS